MRKTKQKRVETFSLLVLLLLGATFIEILHLTYWGADLFFDEAQYWSWAKFPDFGYYSKPPMVAWLITLTTAVCGDGEACTRLSSPLLHLGTALIIYKITHILYNKEKAFYAALVYITMPAVVLSSSLVSTDPSLLFFWALSTLFFVRAMKEHSWKWWLLTGACAGLGMLSKYNMLMFLVSVVAYLGANEKGRKQLFSAQFLMAGMVAFLVFLPNIIWNLHHGMVSFAHTGDNARGSGMALHPSKMLEFVGAQFGVFGPILFGTLLLIFSRIKSVSRYSEERLLICLILPLLILITSISLLSRAHANWAAPIYVPATILVVAWLIENNKKKLIMASLCLHIFVAILFLALPAILKIPGITLSGVETDLASGKIKDPMMRLSGWHELGQGAAALLAAYPDATLLTDAREIHAELLYYARPKDLKAIKWNPSGKIQDHYDLTSDISKSIDGDFIFVTKREELGDEFTAKFDEAERVGNVEINPHGDFATNYYIYYLKGFKGYGE